MNYSDYLKSEHWQRKRKEALEFYGYSCVICQGHPDHVHHRHYETLWHEDVAKDLTVLCEKHHKMAHDIIEPVREFSLTENLFMALTAGWCRDEQ